MLRRDVLSKASDDCLKELYSLCQPKVEWEDFVKMCKTFSKKYEAWEHYKRVYNNRANNPEEWLKIKSSFPAKWETGSITDCIGPRPYEFFYIPREILNSVCDSYIYAYKIDNHQELLDTIDILKNYCKKPIVDKYIEGELREDGTRWPGHRGYDYPDNLIEEVRKILIKYDDHMDSEISEEVVNKFFEFLDMAGNFYDWNGELNSFKTTIYLGCSPSSNKESVIENWKNKNIDIEINEEQMLKEFYGDDDD